MYKGELERGSLRGRVVGENDINWRYEVVMTEPSSVPQANEFYQRICNKQSDIWNYLGIKN